jgi:hypothetical protein
MINHIHANLASSSPTADKENGVNTTTPPTTVSKRLLRVFVTQVRPAEQEPALLQLARVNLCRPLPHCPPPLGTPDGQHCWL